MRRMTWLLLAVLSLALAGVAPIAATAASPTPAGPDARTQQLASYWTAARMKAAVSRDIIVDAQGRSYLRTAQGLQPYGTGELVPRPSVQRVGAEPLASAKAPSGSSDTTAPAISSLSPANGATPAGTTVTFSATVSDAESGVRSATVNLTYPDGRTQNISMGNVSGSSWQVTVQGFFAGTWTWRVTAQNGARLTTTTTSRTFTIGGSSGGSDPNATTNSQYTANTAVLAAAGRIYFEMPANAQRTKWNGYVCSGTVASDGSITAAGSGRSMIVTAGHCVYDDATKTFARNVIFIPNQQASGTATDRDCTNDIWGCWAPGGALVDAQWASKSWPNNIPWDYGYYVVSNTGRHTQRAGGTVSDSLETAVAPMTVRFDAPAKTRTTALGYSYNQDPKLMYCAQDRGFTGGSSSGSSDNWWLGQCGLTGGASGGPWLDEDTVLGTGQIISVNSWGYSGSPGMAGAKLNDSTNTSRTRLPICVYNAATAMTSLSNVEVSSCP